MKVLVVLTILAALFTVASVVEANILDGVIKGVEKALQDKIDGSLIEEIHKIKDELRTIYLQMIAINMAYSTILIAVVILAMRKFTR